MKNDIELLVDKYNTAVPRYTSYPTVPYWDKEILEKQPWINQVKKTFTATNSTKGISLYIHLPFCESLCTYCGCNTRITVNHHVELPYIQTVLKEWKLYNALFDEKPIIAELHLGGGTPTFFAPENLKLLIEEILKDSIVANNAEYSFEGHPANTTYEHLKTLRELGFSRVSYGIQDFNEKVQDAINRYQTVEQVKQVTEWSRQLGYYSVNYDIIYGLPFQTMEGIIDTVQKVINLKPDRIAFYSYAHVPWLKPAQRKFTEADLPERKEKLDLYLKGREMFINAGYLDIGMDHFSLPTDSLTMAFNEGKMHRNFMGFTTNNTRLLIGLGVSSISDSWGAFAQNFKVVEAYQKAVDNGEIPVFKGHLLTEEDALIRQQILEIICKYKTELVPQQNQQTEILNRLKPLAEDGLVEIKGNSIQVTKLGQRFVRNIALAFDIRYWANLPQAQIFSKAV